MSLVHIDWRPDRRGLRKFGVAMLIGFGLMGLSFWFGWPLAASQAVVLALWGFGAVAGLLGLSGTAAALPIYWLWMGIAFVTGSIMGRVTLGLAYYLVFTPMGLLGRLLGRDRLALRRPSTESYWHDLRHDTSPPRYERQF